MEIKKEKRKKRREGGEGRNSRKRRERGMRTHEKVFESWRMLVVKTSRKISLKISTDLDTEK